MADATDHNHRAETVQHPWPGRKVEWGVLVDDLGSIDTYDNAPEAEAAYRQHGGLALVMIETTVRVVPMSTPSGVDSGGASK